MRKKIAFLAACALGVLSIAGVASAAWYVNDDGTGFVGKGDVQTAFGWNNKQLQDNAEGVTFSYASTETVEYDCQWTTGPDHNQTTHAVTRDKTTSISSSVERETRKNSQGKDGPVTGFILLGWEGDPVETGGDVPAVGDPCPGNEGQGAVVTDVRDLGSTGSTLYATYDGVTVALP
jgi:hypothetical protein